MIDAWSHTEEKKKQVKTGFQSLNSNHTGYLSTKEGYFLNEETTLYTIMSAQNKFFVVRRGGGGGSKKKGNEEHDVNMYVYCKWVGVPVQHGWALWPEYFLNLALFHLKIPKSTTQGRDLTGRANHSQGWLSRGPYTFRKNVGQSSGQ